MLKIFGFIVSFLLVTIIFLQVPQESVGLTGFAPKNNILGSPSSVRRLLNILTGLGILVYFGIAIKQNLVNN